MTSQVVSAKNNLHSPHTQNLKNEVNGQEIKFQVPFAQRKFWLKPSIWLKLISPISREDDKVAEKIGQTIQCLQSQTFNSIAFAIAATAQPASLSFCTFDFYTPSERPLPFDFQRLTPCVCTMHVQSAVGLIHKRIVEFTRYRKFYFYFRTRVNAYAAGSTRHRHALSHARQQRQRQMTQFSHA